MSLAHYLERSKALSSLLRGFPTDWLSFRVNEDHSRSCQLEEFSYSTPYLKKILENRANILEVGVTLRLLRGGPKVLELTCEEAAALERIDLAGVTFRDYHQPFPTFVVQLPPSYCTRFGIFVCDEEVRELTGFTQHIPDFVVLYHDHETQTLVTNVHFNSGQVYTRLLWEKPEAPGLSSALERARQYVLPGSEVNDVECTLGDMLTRIAINACLLMSQLGTVNLGPTNPSHYARLKRRNETQQLRLCPIRYGFHQDVRLHHTIRTRSTPSELTGRHSPQPHWRRGHYRRQAHGPNRSLRKLVLVHPVLVMASQFQGTADQTLVTYRNEKTK